VAFHVALVAWLLRREQPQPIRKAPVDIEIVHLSQPAPRAPAHEEPPAKLQATRASTPRAKVTTPSAAPTTPAVERSAPSIALASPMLPVDDLPREVHLAPGPRLFTQGEVVIPAPSPRAPAVTSAAPNERTPSELIAEGQGRRAVENGSVDPYFLELGQALIDSWDAEKHLTAYGFSGWVDQMSENTRIFGSIWRENARRFAISGSPVGAGSAVPTVIDRTGGLNALAARDAYERQLKEQYTARKRALLRVVQNGNGVLRSVTLIEGSDDPATDREAVADVRAAAQKLPKPPAQGLGLKEPIVSLWEFQLIISISPPVPTIAFEFDESLGSFDVRSPLDRRVYKRVKLVAVE
jgi:hypothetical protein